MPEDDVISQIYRLAIDEAALNKLKAGIASGRKSIEDITAKIKEQSVTMERGGMFAAAYVEGLKNQKSALLELEDAATKANKAQEQLTVTNEKASKSGGGSGANIGTIARNLGGLGLGGVADIANVADDVKDLFEQIQKGGQSIPLVVSAAEAMTPALGASAAGFAAIAIPLLPIAAVLGAVALGVKAFNDELEKNREATKLALDGLQRETDLKNQNIADARTRTTEQNRQATADLQQQFNNQETLLAQLEKQRADVDAEYAALGASINPQRRAKLGDIGKELDTRIEGATLVLITLGEQIENTFHVLQPEVDARQAERDAIEAATKAQKEHEQAVKDAAAEQKRTDAEIEQARKQLITVNEQLADTEKKRADQLANRAQEDRRAGEIGPLEAAIQKAQEVEAAQANQDKIVQIRAEGGDAEAKALVAQAARINAINDNFFNAQMKAFNAFKLSEQRATEDYNRSRIRKVEDLNNTLLNLAGARDVAGFINARSAGLTDLSRGDEDNSTSSRRRREDYENQARESDANRQRQLADLMRANEQENEARRNALNAKIQQEVAAGQGQLKQSQILQNQLAALRARYASEDLIARRRNEDEAYNTQVGKLRQRQGELNNIIGGSLNPAVSFMGQLAVAVVNFINQVRNAVTSTAAPYSSGSHAPQGGYASGTDYVPRTGLYQLHQGEAVIPASKNRPYTPAWSKNRGGVNVTINVAGVGSLVSTAELNATVESIVGGLERAVGVA